MEKLKWRNANIVRPTEDGKYLCICESGYIAALHYCAKVDAFNVTDPNDTSSEFKDVVAWTTIDGVYSSIEEDTGIDMDLVTKNYYNEILGIWPE